MQCPKCGQDGGIMLFTSVSPCLRCDSGSELPGSWTRLGPTGRAPAHLYHRKTGFGVYQKRDYGWYLLRDGGEFFADKHTGYRSEAPAAKLCPGHLSEIEAIKKATRVIAILKGVRGVLGRA